MTTDNKIPASDTASAPQASNANDSILDEDMKSFIDACKGQPALLEKSQVAKFEERFAKTGVIRRTALLIVTESYDEFAKKVFDHRGFAEAVADIERCMDDHEDGLNLTFGIVAQSRRWILAALSARDDCDEIMKEVHKSKGGDDAETP